MGANLPIVQLDEGVLWQVSVSTRINGAGRVDDIMLELPHYKFFGQTGLQSPPHDTAGAISPHQEVVVHLQCRAPSSSPEPCNFSHQVLALQIPRQRIALNCISVIS